MTSLYEMLGSDFHYVLLTVVYTLVMNIFLMVKVGMARKKHGVEYPNLYSEKDKLFNCVQRAHQNTLEQLPVFFTLLILVGIELPKFAASCGFIFVTSRFSYAYGYYTGDPKKRLNGEYGILGYFGLFFGLIYVALQLGGYISPIAFPQLL